MSTDSRIFFDFEGRSRLLSAGSLYVDVENDLRDIANDILKDDSNDELRWSLRPLRAEFKTKDSEKLWNKFQARLHHRFLCVLLGLNIFVSLVEISIYFYAEQLNYFPYSALLRFSSLIVFISFIILAYHDERWFSSKFSRTLAAVCVLLAMIYAEYGGILFAIVGDPTAFQWKRSRPVYYLIICNGILLSFPSRVHSSISTIIIVILELTVSILWPHINGLSCNILGLPSGYKYLISDLLFYLFAAMVANYITFLLEIVNRRAFLDHRYCVESKFKLNFERDQQEQLLNSCLPKHLMQKVRDDIRERFILTYETRHNNSSISRPFAELYIEKHKNVTILFADIVNSMLLAQSFSPKELVETLNELYGKFDVRAEANNCMRIKLLGDCYYCVSGIPEYDPNHAMNCINMGLDMIDIIRSLREESQINIDMRIGIHTGMVLSGLLGLRKWQYDIWSIDTMKANEMEHNGKAGFVHVTKTTLDLIPEKSKRKLIIQENQVFGDEITYLITKSNVANERFYMKNKFADHHHLHHKYHSERFHYQMHARNSSLSSRSSRIESINFSRRRTVLEVSLGKYREMLNFAYDYLSKAIDKMPLNIKRQYNGSHSQIEINPFFLHFIPKVSPETKISTFRKLHRIHMKNERAYAKEYDPLFHFYLIGSAMICIAMMTIRLLTIYSIHHSSALVITSIILNVIDFLFIILSFIYIHLKKHQVNFISRIFIWLIISILLILSSMLDMVNCGTFIGSKIDDKIPVTGYDCLYKWAKYYTFSCVLALTNINLYVRINLWIKLILSTLGLVGISCIYWFSRCSVFIEIDRLFILENPNFTVYTPSLVHMQYLFLVYIMLFYIDRQIEYIFRLDFLWTQRLKRERREAQITREINHLLLRNILPVHVAQRYLYDSQEPGQQLYYEAYDSCGVMFAAIPNFNIYAETDTSRDGLGSLKILNEIICEFDKLLNLPRFRSRVEKIKTIGSIYMAASGLQPGKGSIDSILNSEDKPTNVIVLIRFALAMMKCLEKFNIERNHNFKLRIGIAVGPVIAGVVGAVKPQYDIWGDTVNVASRMDTFGLLNHIHITEEVARILLENNLFNLVCRGLVDIKGKGKLVTYLIDFDTNCLDQDSFLPDDSSII